MIKAPLAAAAAVLAMMLAGCGGSPVLARSTTPIESPSVVEPAPESTASLAAMKKAAGIADCPASNSKVEPVPSGLPDVVLPCLGRRPPGAARWAARQADDDQRLGSVVRTVPAEAPYLAEVCEGKQL
jgi:hypothetical protein